MQENAEARVGGAGKEDRKGEKEQAAAEARLERAISKVLGAETDQARRKAKEALAREVLASRLKAAVATKAQAESDHARAQLANSKSIVVQMLATWPQEIRAMTQAQAAALSDASYMLGPMHALKAVLFRSGREARRASAGACKMAEKALGQELHVAIEAGRKEHQAFLRSCEEQLAYVEAERVRRIRGATREIDAEAAVRVREISRERERRCAERADISKSFMERLQEARRQLEQIEEVQLARLDAQLEQLTGLHEQLAAIAPDKEA